MNIFLIIFFIASFNIAIGQNEIIPGKSFKIFYINKNITKKYLNDNNKYQTNGSFVLGGKSYSLFKPRIKLFYNNHIGIGIKTSKNTIFNKYTIDRISIFKPNKEKTIEGINIGKSIKKDIIKIYEKNYNIYSIINL